MANINQDQRKELLKIIEANGRSQEFYDKFGKDRVTKHKAKAESLLAKIVANDGEQDKAKSKQAQEEKELEAKHKKENDGLDKIERNLKAELAKLGYSINNQWVGGSYQTTLEEDTTVTRAEYEMFKKRAVVAVTCASTLEEAQKAITNYLDLVK